METHYLFTQLRCMFGIVAVGTSAGHIFFLDLALDEDFTCDENLPNITFVLKKFELLPERRERAITKQQHIFMLLNGKSYIKNLKIINYVEKVAFTLIKSYFHKYFAMFNLI